VVAPLANVEVPSRRRDIGPYRIAGTTAFYKGAVLPEDIDQDLLDRLVLAGQIEPVEKPA
jgi:hypothetical protein